MPGQIAQQGIDREVTTRVSVCHAGTNNVTPVDFKQPVVDLWEFYGDFIVVSKGGIARWSGITLLWELKIKDLTESIRKMQLQGNRLYLLAKDGGLLCYRLEELSQMPIAQDYKPERISNEVCSIIESASSGDMFYLRFETNEQSIDLMNEDGQLIVQLPYTLNAERCGSQVGRYFVLAVATAPDRLAFNQSLMLYRLDGRLLWRSTDALSTKSEQAIVGIKGFVRTKRVFVMLEYAAMKIELAMVTKRKLVRFGILRVGLQKQREWTVYKDCCLLARTCTSLNLLVATEKHILVYTIDL